MTTEPGELAEVRVTGRRIDADLIAGALEAHGIKVVVWGGGMGVWRAESALTEMTGVPNAFNAYRVMVPAERLEEAREVLGEDRANEPTPDVVANYLEGGRSFMQALRSRWLLVPFAVFMLLMIVLGSRPT